MRAPTFLFAMGMLEWRADERQVLEQGMNQRSETHTGIGRVAIAATLAGLLGMGAIAMPTTAFAEMTTTRSYTWKDGEQKPSAAQTVTSNGVTYTLKGTSNPVKSGSDSTLTQSFTTTQTGTASDVNGVQAAVPSSTQYSEDGYSGTLYRTSVSYTPVYVSKDQPDNAKRIGTATGKEHPADSTLPGEIYQNGHKLTRTSVTWEKTGGDSERSIWQYTAQYSGTYQERVLDHYDVTGTYSGNLTKTVNGGTWSMTATYTAPDQQQDAEDTGDTQTLSEEQNANQDDAQNQNADNAENADSNENAESGYEIQNAENADENGNSDSSKNANANTSSTAENNGVIGMVQKHPLLLLIPVILIIAIVAAIVAALKKKHKATAGVITAAPLAIPADIYGLNAELIEFVNDGTDENQRVIATCDAYMSPDADTPSLVEIPQPPMHFEPAETVDADGNPVKDEEGNQVYDDYYIVISGTSYDAVASGVTDDNGYVTLEDVPNGNYLAITDSGQPQPVIISNGTAMETELVADGTESDLDVDSITRDNVGFVPGDAAVRVFVRDADGNPLSGMTVDLLSDGLLSSAKSSRLVIESNGHAIYDGTLATQVKVDSKLLADALNDEIADGEGSDITEDVDRWLNAYEDYDERRNETIEQVRQQREADAQVEAAKQDTSSIPTDATGEEAGEFDDVDESSMDTDAPDDDTKDTTAFSTDTTAPSDGTTDGGDSNDTWLDDMDDSDPENFG